MTPGAGRCPRVAVVQNAGGVVDVTGPAAFRRRRVAVRVDDLATMLMPSGEVPTRASRTSKVVKRLLSSRKPGKGVRGCCSFQFATLPAVRVSADGGSISRRASA
jgi:hypothetical protein